MKARLHRHNDKPVFIRLLAVLILLTVVPGAFVSYIIYRMEAARHIEQVSVLLNSLAADRELATRLLMDKQRDALDYLAKDTKTVALARGLVAGPGPVNPAPLVQMVNRSVFFYGLSVADIYTGRHRDAGVFPKESLDNSLEDIKKSQNGSFVRIEAIPGGEYALVAGQRLQEIDGSTEGAAIFGIARINILNDLFSNVSMLGSTGESFLTDPDGVAVTTLRYSRHSRGHSITAKPLQGCLAGESKAFIITDDYMDVPTAMSYRPVKGYGGCIMVHIRAGEVLAPVKTLRNMVVAIVGVTVSASALTAFLIVGKLLRMDRKRKELEEALADHGLRMEAMVEERTAELKNEIKGRIGAELKLKESEAFLENIVHNVHESIFAIRVGPGGGFLFMWWNSNAQKLVGAGPSEAGERSPEDLFGPKTGARLSERYSQCLREGILDYEETFNTPDGPRIMLTTLVPVKDEAGAVTQIISSSMDITSRKKLEEEIIRAQKLESLGVLAGGIAHDFNNLLAAIRLNTSILKQNPRLDPETLDMIRAADTSAALAADLTNQLLVFARGGKPMMKAVHVRELISEVVNFSLRGTKTSCRLNFSDGLFDIEADPAQMMQVINNMLINADQAMPDGGTVTLSAENVLVTGSESGLPLREGRYVRMTVEDNGTGIAEKDLPRIFDPYFTTKKRGTGLGLASSYMIIKNHKGYISVRSGIGRGTAFDIYVPASAGTAALGPKGTDTALKGSGRVLVMDDEDLVRKSLCRVLRSLGYEAESSANGEEALMKYAQGMRDGRPFDAVILDLIVSPGMGGEEAAGKILKLDPSARLFASSGYSSTPVLADFKRYGFCGSLKKPYEATELNSKLREAIKKERV